ncbi:hypothetical protein [Nocardia sp. NPDC052566]|uniref:hypothetical protein n=1 Tax=Nocardia sp. NPDC052566 TaxID=3364330 RepID=UPI0037C834A3
MSDLEKRDDLCRSRGLCPATDDLSDIHILQAATTLSADYYRFPRDGSWWRLLEPLPRPVSERELCDALGASPEQIGATTLALIERELLTGCVCCVCAAKRPGFFHVTDDGRQLIEKAQP